MTTTYPTKHGGASFDEIAAEMGISPEMVRLIEKQALKKLRAIVANPTLMACKSERLKRALQAADIVSEAIAEDENDYPVRARVDWERRV